MTFCKKTFLPQSIKASWSVEYLFYGLYIKTSNHAKRYLAKYMVKNRHGVSFWYFVKEKKDIWLVNGHAMLTGCLQIIYLFTYYVHLFSSPIVVKRYLSYATVVQVRGLARYTRFNLTFSTLGNDSCFPFVCCLCMFLFW